MKKEIEVTKKATIAYCDVCGVRSSNQCLICGRDICGGCAYEDIPGSGDYPSRYCKSCWDAGEPFRREMKNLKDHFDSQMQGLDEGWVRVAKRFAKGAE